MTIALAGRSGKTIQYDEIDSPLITKYNWYFIPDSISGHAYTKINRQTVYLHRLILNAPKDLEVDHINHDGLDNRRKNLRLVTSTENKQNLPLYKTNKVGQLGVYWYKPRSKWKAHIQRNNKRVLLGYFDDLEEAKRVAREARPMRFMIR